MSIAQSLAPFNVIGRMDTQPPHEATIPDAERAASWRHMGLLVRFANDERAAVRSTYLLHHRAEDRLRTKVANHKKVKNLTNITALGAGAVTLAANPVMDAIGQAAGTNIEHRGAFMVASAVAAVLALAWTLWNVWMDSRRAEKHRVAGKMYLGACLRM